MVSQWRPGPLRWLVGVELARYRNLAKLSLTKASTVTGISKAKLGHLETGRQHQSPDDITQLLTAYGATQREITRLTSLADRADEANWWTPWAPVLPDWFTTFVGLEGVAESEFVFESMIIPGLLQTPEYATAVTAEATRVRADHAERFVEFRMARAALLTKPERPLRLHAVLTEGALRVAIGSPELRQAQLRHLVTMAQRPSVTIQVYRPENALCTATGGHFAVLGFEAVNPIAYAELQDDAVYLHDPDQVRRYTLAAQDLQRVALDPERSVAFIESMITS